MENKVFDAVQLLFELQIWPSARNVAIAMGRKHEKLRGDENRMRKQILRELYCL